MLIQVNTNYLCRLLARHARALFTVSALLLMSMLLSACSVLGSGDDGVSPAPPTTLVAEGEEGAVRLSWQPPEGQAVDGFHVYRDTSADFAVGEGAPVSGEAPVDEAVLTDTDVVNGTTYYYRVTAVGKGGESEGSAATEATPLPSPPDRP